MTVEVTRARMDTLAGRIIKADIGRVNRLIHSLTPVNRKAAIGFFTAHLEWEKMTDDDGNFINFGKKMSSMKKVEKIINRRITFLADDNMTFWQWADDNTELKPIDFASGIQSSIKRALKGNDKRNSPALSQMDVAQIVLNELDSNVLQALIEQQSLAMAAAANQYLEQPTHEGNAVAA